MQKKPSSIRYAVVGLGQISQEAVLPAFTGRGRAQRSELALLVSGDRRKLKALARRFKVPKTMNYDEFEKALEAWARKPASERADFSAQDFLGVDAVYIATPNTLHEKWVRLAAQAGLHVLCEKPLAMDSRSCARMISACQKAKTQLMVAYRLHFNEAHLKAIELIQRGRLGKPRIFSSVFTFNLKDANNIRLQSGLGGGPLHDIGIYCVNASRYLFGEEPEEVFAFASQGLEKRFSEVPEMLSVALRFPEGRLATFVVSFGAEASADFEVLGSDGKIRLKNAYEYESAMKMEVVIKGKSKTLNFKKSDQFATEIAYFSERLLNRQKVQPAGDEGLKDIAILEAIERSQKLGRAVKLKRVLRTEFAR